MENELKTAKKRCEIDDSFKWQLSDIYSTDEAWENDFTYLKEHMNEIDGFKGTLTNSSDDLLKALTRIDELSLIMERLYVYAHMRKDEDNSVSKYQGMTDRAMSLNVELSSKTAFVDPEILSAPNDTITKFIEENAGLEPFDFYLTSLMRSKEHILDEKMEEVMALTHEMASAPKTIFTMLNNVDLQFGTVKDEDGNTVELTHGRYGDLMRSNDRTVREQTFKQFYKEFGDHTNTIAGTLNGSVKAGLFYTRMRKFNTPLEASLFSDNVPVSVYDNLIKVINDGLPKLHEYFDVKRKALGLDEMHMYDIYAPIESKEAKDKIPFENAKDILLSGLAPLGEEYKGLLETAFRDKWMDVYENTGKTSGAYCWGVYGTHPFVLLNYQDNLDSVFTIAHELGHAMHSHYSDTSLPYSKAQYTIFVAEVASTVNEVLLNYYMLKTTKDKEKRIAIIHHFIEQFRTTLFRQTMFAEYEKTIHNAAMEGTPLTADYLTQTYYDLNKKYHENIVCDEEIGLEWSRIPHFYNSFYVYKYATGFSAAVAIAKNVLDNGDKDGYIKMLQSGGSDYPIELLKLAKVDMSTTKPIEDCLAVFGEMVDMLKELV